VGRTVRFVFAAIPAARLIVATVLTQHGWPRSIRSAWLQGRPSRAWTRVWSARITPRNADRRGARTSGGRSRPAEEPAGPTGKASLSTRTGQRPRWGSGGR
jgi:hypothetical protein